MDKFEAEKLLKNAEKKAFKEKLLLLRVDF